MRRVRQLLTMVCLSHVLLAARTKDICRLNHCPIKRDPLAGLPFVSDLKLQSRFQQIHFKTNTTSPKREKREIGYCQATFSAFTGF